MELYHGGLGFVAKVTVSAPCGECNAGRDQQTLRLPYDCAGVTFLQHLQSDLVRPGSAGVFFRDGRLFGGGFGLCRFGGLLGFLRFGGRRVENQHHAGIDVVACHAVKLLDERIQTAVAEETLGYAPQGVTVLDDVVVLVLHRFFPRLVCAVRRGFGVLILVAQDYAPGCIVVVGYTNLPAGLVARFSASGFAVLVPGGVDDFPIADIHGGVRDLIEKHITALHVRPGSQIHLAGDILKSVGEKVRFHVPGICGLQGYACVFVGRDYERGAIVIRRPPTRPLIVAVAVIGGCGFHELRCFFGNCHAIPSLYKGFYLSVHGSVYRDLFYLVVHGSVCFLHLSDLIACGGIYRDISLDPLCI